jgi:GNAT superfamily N-acetyltransferase
VIRDVVTIRAAAPADVPALADLEVRAGEPFRSIGLGAVADSPPPEPDGLLAHVHAGTAWVAELDGSVVGYAIAGVVDGDGHIDQVSVLPEVQGRGIGRSLVQAVLDWSRREGHHAVTLTTFMDVPWNGPWYERLGFRFLHDEELGPQLQGIRRRERAAGLDLRPRAAMRRTSSP